VAPDPGPILSIAPEELAPIRLGGGLGAGGGGHGVDGRLPEAHSGGGGFEVDRRPPAHPPIRTDWHLHDLTGGRGLHSFPFLLNLNLLCPLPLNLSLLCPPYDPNKPLDASRRCSR